MNHNVLYFSLLLTIGIGFIIQEIVDRINDPRVGWRKIVSDLWFLFILFVIILGTTGKALKL